MGIITPFKTLVGTLSDKSSLSGEISLNHLNLQEKSVTPSDEIQEIVPDVSYDGLSKVIVNKSVSPVGEAILVVEGAVGETGGAEYIGNYKNALGANITLTDAAMAELQSLIIYGKSTQDGTPTPANPVEIVSLDCTSATFTINDTTLALPAVGELCGIPVDTGGTYTDENGQQWICDYIDVFAKKYVRQIYTPDISTLTFITHKYTNDSYYVAYGYTLPMAQSKHSLSSHFTGANTSLELGKKECVYVLPNKVGDCLHISIDKSAASTPGALKQWLIDNGVVIRYALKEPIVTALTDEQIEALQELYIADGTTAISNSMGADMNITYLAKGV